MKTKAQKTNSRPTYSSKPFFTKQDQNGFFNQNNEGEKPFFITNTVQPKLNLGESGDKYEKEADAVAGKVVSRIDLTAMRSMNQSNYNTTSRNGQHLLANDLPHVAHQNQLSKPLIQRATWTQPTKFKEENPLEMALTNKPIGLTTRKVENNSFDLTTKSILLTIFPQIGDTTMKSSNGKFIASIRPSYDIASTCNVQIASAPNDKARDAWTYRANPALLKVNALPNAKSCSGKTSALIIARDPGSNADFVDRVKNGELQHVSSFKELNERFFPQMERLIKKLSGTGATEQDAANDLSNKIGSNLDLMQLIDAYILQFNSEVANYWDVASYGLHHSEIKATSVNTGCTEIEGQFQNRYSNATVADPENQNPGPAGPSGGKVGYFKKIAPVEIGFHWQKVGVSGKDIVKGDGTVLLSFSSVADAQKAYNTILHYRFNSMEKIGAFQLFLVDGNIPSGNFSDANNLSLEPRFTTIGFDGGWNISQADRRASTAAASVTQILGFGNSLQAMNEARSAYELIKKYNLYKFNWIGGSQLNPVMSFFNY